MTKKSDVAIGVLLFWVGEYGEGGISVWMESDVLSLDAQEGKRYNWFLVLCFIFQFISFG